MFKNLVLGVRPCYSLSFARGILYPPGIEHMEPKTHAEVNDTVVHRMTHGPHFLSPSDEELVKLAKDIPKTQKELPPRRMLDSFDQMIIPLGRNEDLRPKYINHFGGIRIGRILEEMDVFAVHLVSKHLHYPHLDYVPCIVMSILVNEMYIDHQVNCVDDIMLSGHVTWVGKTSVDTLLVLKQMQNGKWKECIEAAFFFVAFSKFNHKPTYINPLILETPKEEALCDRAKRIMKRRQTQKTTNLLDHPPTTEETAIMHNLFAHTVDHKTYQLKHFNKIDNVVWMEKAGMQKVILCHTEFKNAYNRIFGGFIMKEAWDLAWTNAYVFAKERCEIVFIDDVTFQLPVKIGSILYFNSQVGYSSDRYIQVAVSATILSPEMEERTVSNMFNFTFEPASGKVPPTVIPRTYKEAMVYIDQRRHFLRFLDRSSSS